MYKWKWVSFPFIQENRISLYACLFTEIVYVYVNMYIYTYTWNNIYTLTSCIPLGPQRTYLLYNLHCCCFRIVVLWKLETFYFHFQHIYMHPFVRVISCASIVLCSEQLSIRGISRWILLNESKRLSSLQPKTTSAEMMPASICALISSRWTGDAPGLNCGGTAQGCAVALETFEATSLFFLARRTSYFFCLEKFFLKVGSWRFFLVSELSIY